MQFNYYKFIFISIIFFEKYICYLFELIILHF